MSRSRVCNIICCTSAVGLAVAWFATAGSAARYDMLRLGGPHDHVTIMDGTIHVWLGAPEVGDRPDLSVPLWALMPLAMFYPVAILVRSMIIRTRRWGRRQAGRCSQCGYFLRGLSTAICPECGNAYEWIPDRNLQPHPYQDLALKFLSPVPSRWPEATKWGCYCVLAVVCGRIFLQTWSHMNMSLLLRLRYSAARFPTTMTIDSLEWAAPPLILSVGLVAVQFPVVAAGLALACRLAPSRARFAHRWFLANLFSVPLLALLAPLAHYAASLLWIRFVSPTPPGMTFGRFVDTFSDTWFFVTWLLYFLIAPAIIHKCLAGMESHRDSDAVRPQDQLSSPGAAP